MWPSTIKAAKFLNRLWSSMPPPLLGWAFRKTGDGYEAEELAQEVLLQILTALYAEQ